MTNSSRTTLWAILTVLHLPMLVVPWLYWRNRHHALIKVRRPNIFMMTLLATFANIWFILIGNALGLCSYCMLSTLIVCPMLIFLCESWFIFALTLYIAYGKTKEQMILYQAIRDSTDGEATQKNIRSIELYSFLLSERFAYTWTIGHTLLWTIIVLIDIWIRIGVSDLMAPVDLTDNLLVVGRAFLTIIGMAILSWRLRLVQDAFGTKALLKQCGSIGVINLAFLIFLDDMAFKLSDLRFNDLVNLSLTDTIFVIAFAIPACRAQRSSRGIIDYNMVDGNMTTTLKTFLLTEDGFEAFKSHLEKEFSVENLLFWKDVVLFRESYATEPGSWNYESINLAWQIYDKYLSKSAPLEVNLSSEQLTRFREGIFVNRSGDHSAITATIFDESAKQILLLMEIDSLTRFLNTEPSAWKRFLAVQEETIISRQVDTLVNARRHQSLSSTTRSVISLDFSRSSRAWPMLEVSVPAVSNIPESDSIDQNRQNETLW